MHFRRLCIRILFDLATSGTQTGRLKAQTLLLLCLKAALWAFVCGPDAEWVAVPASAASHPPEHSAICYTPAKRWELSSSVHVMCAEQAVSLSVLDVTCMELIMVLRANTVAESLSVDWLSNVPCVSISSTATYRPWEEIQATHK